MKHVAHQTTQDLRLLQLSEKNKGIKEHSRRSRIISIPNPVMVQVLVIWFNFWEPKVNIGAVQKVNTTFFLFHTHTERDCNATYVWLTMPWRPAASLTHFNLDQGDTQKCECVCVCFMCGGVLWCTEKQSKLLVFIFAPLHGAKAWVMSLSMPCHTVLQPTWTSCRW